MKIRTLILILICFFTSAPSFAANVLRVGIVSPVPPFAIVGEHTYGGIIIDIWELIAANEKLQYQYVLLGHNTDNAIMALHNGKVDVLLGPVSITSARYKLVDFSFPYFLNEVGVVEVKTTTGMGQILQVFVDIVDSTYLLWFLAFFIIYTHALWLFERGSIPGFPKGYFKGISYVLWPHLLQKGMKIIPKTIWGRLVSLVWVIAAAILVTSILATVTSKLTLSLVTPESRFNRISDLQDETVAVVKGSQAVNDAEEAGARVMQAENTQQALDWLEQGKVVAVVEDYVLAKTFIDTHDYPKLQMSPLILSNDEYGIAVATNSPLLRKINGQLLYLQDSDATLTMCTRYIGPHARACKL